MLTRGFLAAQWDESPARRKRKIYRLTEMGATELDRAKARYEAVVRTLDAIMGKRR